MVVRLSRFLDFALGQPLGLANEGGVKGGELLAFAANGKMQGIGEIQPLPGKIDGQEDYLRPVDSHIRHAEDLGKGIADGNGRKIIGKAQNPFGFEDDGFRDEDIVFGKQAYRLLDCSSWSRVRSRTMMFVSTAITGGLLCSFTDGIFHLAKGLGLAFIAQTGRNLGKGGFRK